MIEGVFTEQMRRLFVPLACSNATFYMECVTVLQDYISKQIDGLPKEEVITIIQRCLESRGAPVAAEDDDVDELPEEQQSTRRKYGKVLTKEMVYRKLDYYGWFATEPSEDGHTILVTLDPCAEELVLCLRRMSVPKKIFLGGYAQSILSSVTNAANPQTKHPFQGALFVAMESARELSKSVRAIRNSLRAEVEKLIFSAPDYNTALKNYNEFIGRGLTGDVYQLQREGVDAALQQEVQSKLEIFSNYNMEDKEQEEWYRRVLHDIMDFFPDIEDEEEAEEVLRSCIASIRDSVGTPFKEKMDSIHNTQTKYLNNALTKITMICTEDNMVERDINLLIAAISDMDDDEYEEYLRFRSGGAQNAGLFEIYSASCIDDGSLMNARTGRVDDMSEDVLLDMPSTPILFTDADRRKVNPKLAPKFLNAWTSLLLRGREEVRAEEISINNMEEFDRLVAIAISADNPLVEFEVVFEPSGERVKAGKLTVPKFTLRPKKKDR